MDLFMVARLAPPDGPGKTRFFLQCHSFELAAIDKDEKNESLELYNFLVLLTFLNTFFISHIWHSVSHFMIYRNSIILSKNSCFVCSLNLE